MQFRIVELLAGSFAQGQGVIEHRQCGFDTAHLRFYLELCPRKQRHLDADTLLSTHRHT